MRASLALGCVTVPPSGDSTFFVPFGNPDDGFPAFTWKKPD